MSASKTEMREATEKTTLTDRLVEAACHGSDLSREARVAKSMVKDAVEDGLHAAKRAFTSARRRVEQVEDYKDDAVRYFKRRPLTSVAVAAASGVAIGLVFGWVIGRRGASVRSESYGERQ